MTYYTEGWRERLLRFIGWCIGILFISTIIYLIGIGRKEVKRIEESEKMFNVYAVIVEMNGQDIAYVGKNHIPTNTNTVLFKVVREGYPNAHFKLTQHDWSLGMDVLTDPWMYNHRVGDTVHFEFISRKRFFNIER